MILAVAGDRYYGDWVKFTDVLKREIDKWGVTSLVIGDCSGTDTMAYDYATMNNVPYTIYCASTKNYIRLTNEGAEKVVLVSDWRRQGKAAGPIRNFRLLKACDRGVLFDGGGPGSNNVRVLASNMGKELEQIVLYKPSNLNP